MSDVTRILQAAQRGEPQAAEQLWPLVYHELRRLAAARLAHEQPGQTLQATALVHEAYLRLVGPADGTYDSRAHFFAAAAEAMRRILIDQARRRLSQKHGGDFIQADIDVELLAGREQRDPAEILSVHEALEKLAGRSPRKAELVKLRYFLGCTVPEAAEILGIAAATAEEDWTYARAWLRREWLRGQSDENSAGGG